VVSLLEISIIMNAQDNNSIRFQVIEASSEHPDYPASQLLLHESKGKGWQSGPNSSFPQHLILQPTLPKDAISFKLSKMHLLMHESKIPQKIEIFLADSEASDGQEFELKREGDNNNNNTPSYRRLGYITLDKNESSNYQARELKSISIGNISVSFIKLLIHACHNVVNLDDKYHNDHEGGINPLCQVGIISIKLFGEVETSTSSTSMLTTIDTKILLPSNASVGIVPLEKGSKTVTRETKTLKCSSGQTTIFNDVQSCLDRLETFKHESAEKEDFDSAAKIKETLLRVRTLFEGYKKFQTDMCIAATDEDYAEASRLKNKRDEARIVVMGSLKEAERFVLALVQEKNSTEKNFHRLEDLSLSAITNGGSEDNSTTLTSMTGRSFPRNQDNRPIICRQQSDVTNNNDSTSNYLNRGFNEIITPDEDGEHPLEGIPDFMNLPLPEEIHKRNGVISTSNTSSDTNTSSDSITKMENIIGLYCTRCLLSKNWVLREAALMKASMILPEKIKELNQQEQSKTDTFMGWWDSFSRGIYAILEKAIDDRIVQVFLTGLLLLDDCITGLEDLDLKQKDVISFLGNIVPNLINKLGDRNSKVVDGAETALTCLAMSKSIGPSYISMLVIKQPLKERNGKSLCGRVGFLRTIINEFGQEGPKVRKILEFLHECGFSHKDLDVRDAAKELSTALVLRDGNVALSMLEDFLSDRQLKEYRSAFAEALKKSRKDIILEGCADNETIGKKKLNCVKIRQSSASSSCDEVLNDRCIQQQQVDAMHGNGNNNNKTIRIENLPQGAEVSDRGDLTPGRKGRGRGRGRGRVRSTFTEEENVGLRRD